MAGKLNIVRHEAHTGVTLAFSAAAVAGAALKVTGSKQVGPAAAGDVVVGTAVSDVALNEKGTMRVRGDVIPMTAAAAVAAGAELVANAGKVQAKSAETGHAIFGVALTSAAAADDEILVIVL